MKRFFGRRQQERENEDIEFEPPSRNAYASYMEERNNDDLPEFVTKCGTHDDKDKQKGGHGK
jgi:hypothetical protein